MATPPLLVFPDGGDHLAMAERMGQGILGCNGVEQYRQHNAEQSSVTDDHNGFGRRVAGGEVLHKRDKS